MFEATTYETRRRRLRDEMSGGLVLFLGSELSPMNYPDNHYPFWQDRSFLYYWGLDSPGLAAILDVDTGEEILFGSALTIDDIVWTGPLPSMEERAERVGVTATESPSRLAERLAAAASTGRTVHFLPQYRPFACLEIQRLLGIPAGEVNQAASEELIRTVVGMRAVKSAEEVEQIEWAIGVSRDMHVAAMSMSRPGLHEQEVAGAVEGVALSRGGRLSFPMIFTVHGEVLHNHGCLNVMRDGDIVVHDSGVSGPLGYASDITRTIPVSGRFTDRQRDVYEIVLDAQSRALDAVRPGVPWRDIHLTAALAMTEGLRDLGLMRGDPEEAVAEGAHAIFFQCGVGHMVGLDVHDMEGLGEAHVGYGGGYERSDQFGLCYLRMARPVEPGFVMCVEPGTYFVPELMDQWRAEHRFEAFIDYDAFDAYRDFGGIRVEDDIVVTEDGKRILGPPIPLTVDEVEAACAG